jgi:hypothetical protein
MAPSVSTANGHASVARKPDDHDDDDVSSAGSSLLDEDVLHDARAGGSSRAEVREQAWTDAAPTQPSGFFGEQLEGQRDILRTRR